MIEIQRNEVHLWCVYDQEITDEALLRDYQELLSDEEKTRWQRFKFPQHRHQFLITRALVRSVLAQYVDCPSPSELVFNKNEYGKPELQISERLTQVEFNLSHTDGLIILAVSFGHQLGVDVEKITRKVEVSKLAQRYFSSSEANGLDRLAPLQQNKRFFDLWTLKEAYIKACGMGLTIPLDEFSFSFENKTIVISFVDSLKDNPMNWRFWQYEIAAKYQVALAINCIDGSEFNLVWKKGIPLNKFEVISLLSKREKKL